MDNEMNIPFSFYFRFWLRGSFLSLFTAFIVIVLIPPLFAALPYLPFFGPLIYQVFAYRYFYGIRRGDFEYKYRESIIESAIGKSIARSFGTFGYIKFKLDNLNQIRNSQLHMLQKFLKDTGDNLENKFAACLKLAEVYSTHGDYEKQKTFLKESVHIKKSSIVANLRLAVLFESEGESANAIEQYESTLRDSEISSEQLKKFVRNQIERVRTTGPKKKPPLPGLRYVTW